MNKNIILSCRQLQKTFLQGKIEVPVLLGINLEVIAAERVAIIGASGSGKSTLLHLLGGLDHPSSGEIQITGLTLKNLSETHLSQVRNQTLGFVYQFHHLLMEFTAVENVAMPLLIRRLPRAQAQQKAVALLKEVGLGHRLHHTPGELSGGERQRASLARALVTQPQCVLADEPTGNLDRYTAQQMFELILQLNETHQTSFVIVTHDPALAKTAQRILKLQDGVLVGE